MNLTLRRLTFNGTSPTYGVLINDTQPICLTLELPWKDNQHMISCIPPGTYAVIPNTPEKPWRLVGVTDRTEIDIHVANSCADILGCIGLGLQFGTNIILRSVDAVNYLKTIVPENWMLTIVNPVE